MMRELGEWGIGFVCAAVAFVAAFSCATTQAQDRSVVLMVDEARRGGLGEALSVELAARQTEVRTLPPPGGGTPLARASEAQAAAREAQAEAAIWVDEASSAQGGGAMVRAVGRDREEIRHAPLPQPLATVEPRVFAVVAASLIDEIVSPPEPPITVRINVHVDAGGREVRVVPTTPETAPGGAVETTPTPPAPPVPPEPPVAPQPPAVIVVPAPAAPAAPAPPPPAPPPPPALPEQDVREVAFGVDFVPYVGTSTFAGGRERRRISLGVLGALTHQLDGIGLAGIAHVDSGWVRGWEISGVANLNAGFLDGVQIAGVANVTGSSVDGLQLAGFANFANGPVEGTQISGGLNVVHGDVAGAQIGVVNVASGRVRGLQLGVINVAEDADVALGLVSVLWNGRTQLEAVGTETGFGTVSLKHGSRHFHSIYGIGVRPFANELDSALVLGLGGRAYLSDSLYVDIDATCAWLHDDFDGSDSLLRILNTARALLAWRVSESFALVGGLSLNVLVTDDPADLSGYGGPFGESEPPPDAEPVPRDHLVIREFHTGTVTWPGVTLGVHLF